MLRIEALEDRTVPTTIDLTTPGAVGSAGGVYFAQYDARQSDGQPTTPFVQLNGPLLLTKPTQGYNTNARPLQFDENASFTHALRRSDIPTVMVGGALYREFVLDVNQLTLLTPRVSLDQLRLYVADTGNLTGYSAANRSLGGLTPVYDMDAGSDSWVVLDARLNTVSGGDMRMYVPDAALAGGAFVYLFSRFGDHFAPLVCTQRWSVFVGESPTPPPFSPPPPPPPTGGATISGIVYGDLNGNLQQDDNESGLPDRTVYLDTDRDGVCDEGESSISTDADGWFAFTELEPGVTYSVRVITNAGEFAPGFDVTPTDGEIVPVDIGVEGNVHS